MSSQTPMKPLRVVLACGGTGGHIFPALSVAEEIKKKHPSAYLVYVCGKKDIENAIFRIISGARVHSVESAPFRGGFSFLNPAFLLKLTIGLVHSFWILALERPRVVVGFGGHYSFPVMVAARCMGIQTILHEQNVVPGMANKVLTRWVDAVALSFAETEKYLPKNKCMRVTGNPIRSFIERNCREEALRFFCFSTEKTTVLVLGGSQGAESISAIFLEALKNLPELICSDLQVIHLCGKMPPVEAEESSLKRGVFSRAYSFFERMDMAYGTTDFAIGRAGATFLAEMTSKKIPGILVPYPFAGGHQRLNAKAFLKDEESVVIEQCDLNAARLAQTIEEFYHRSLQKKQSGFIRNRAVSQVENSRICLMNLIEERAS